MTTCCHCDPIQCETDDTGEHCQDMNCGRCLYGCPATDEADCCLGSPTRAREATDD